MEDKFIYCEEAENEFGKTKKSVSYNGDVSVDYLTSNSSPSIETGAREYQREKVASLSFKQLIMLTVISNGYRKIPQVHIRVIKAGKAFRFELIDGQQRITSFLLLFKPLSTLTISGLTEISSFSISLNSPLFSCFGTEFSSCLIGF